MYAVESGERTRSVPAKSTIVSTALGITVIVGALTFAASLDRFVTTPESYGWAFDALLSVGDVPEDEMSELGAWIPEIMGQLESVEGWSTSSLQQASVGGSTIPVMGISESVGAPTYPTLVDGRFPAAPDEVALGAVTAREVGVGIGDTVPVGFDKVPAEVVGIVVLPGLANYPGSDQAALGVGALFTQQGFAIATSLGFVDDDGGPGGVLVSLVDDDPAALARLQEEIDAVVGEDTIIVEGSLRPSDVGGYAAIRSTPVVLAAILGLLAAMTVGHGLIVSVRQRRRDFAVFRSLGFTRGSGDGDRRLAVDDRRGPRRADRAAVRPRDRPPRMGFGRRSPRDRERRRDADCRCGAGAAHRARAVEHRRRDPGTTRRPAAPGPGAARGVTARTNRAPPVRPDEPAVLDPGFSGARSSARRWRRGCRTCRARRHRAGWSRSR